MSAVLAKTASGYYESFLKSRYIDFINEIKEKFPKGMIVKSYEIFIRCIIKVGGKYEQPFIIETKGHKKLFKIPKDDLELYNLILKFLGERQKETRTEGITEEELEEAKTKGEATYREAQAMKSVLNFPYGSLPVTDALSVFRELFNDPLFIKRFEECFQKCLQKMRENPEEEKYLSETNIKVTYVNASNLEEEFTIELKKNYERRCHGPGCEKMLTTMEKLQACAACLQVYYCSRECQKTDWGAGHKKEYHV